MISLFLPHMRLLHMISLLLLLSLLLPHTRGTHLNLPPKQCSGLSRAALDAAGFESDHFYVRPDDDRCFVLSKASDTCVSCQAMCAEKLNGTLATILEADAEELLGHLAPLYKRGDAHDGWWTGLYWYAGSWRWVSGNPGNDWDGQPFGWDNWAPSQPSNMCSELCVIMGGPTRGVAFGRYEQGQWYDLVNTNATHRCLCETPSEPDELYLLAEEFIRDGRRDDCPAHLPFVRNDVQLIVHTVFFSMMVLSVALNAFFSRSGGGSSTSSTRAGVAPAAFKKARESVANVASAVLKTLGRPDGEDRHDDSGGKDTFRGSRGATSRLVRSATWFLLIGEHRSTRMRIAAPYMIRYTVAATYLYCWVSTAMNPDIEKPASPPVLLFYGLTTTFSFVHAHILAVDLLGEKATDHLTKVLEPLFGADTTAGNRLKGVLQVRSNKFINFVIGYRSFQTLKQTKQREYIRGYLEGVVVSFLVMLITGYVQTEQGRASLPLAIISSINWGWSWFYVSRVQRCPMAVLDLIIAGHVAHVQKMRDQIIKAMTAEDVSDAATFALIDKIQRVHTKLMAQSMISIGWGLHVYFASRCFGLFYFLYCFLEMLPGTGLPYHGFVFYGVLFFTPLLAMRRLYSIYEFLRDTAELGEAYESLVNRCLSAELFAASGRRFGDPQALLAHFEHSSQREAHCWVLFASAMDGGAVMRIVGTVGVTFAVALYGVATGEWEWADEFVSS